MMSSIYDNGEQLAKSTAEMVKKIVGDKANYILIPVNKEAREMGLITNIHKGETLAVMITMIRQLFEEMPQETLIELLTNSLNTSDTMKTTEH
jgi:hypothetical protein